MERTNKNGVRQFGVMSTDHVGTSAAKQKPGFLTNLHVAFETLTIRCTRAHRHVQLVNGRARDAEAYQANCVSPSEGPFTIPHNLMASSTPTVTCSHAVQMN